MSKKVKTEKTAAVATDAQVDGDVTIVKRGGRKPMTADQKAKAKTARLVKELGDKADVADPELWSALPPETLLKIEKAVVHVRTVVHQAEKEALKARLAALEVG